MSDRDTPPSDGSPRSPVPGESADEPPAGGSERTPSDESPPGTVCPLCAVGCRLRPRESGDRARGVAGPANRNGRLCRKGIGAFDGTGPGSADDRLTEPTVRRDGEAVATGWDDALAAAVAGLEQVRARHGPEALAFLGAPHCTNEENYLLGKLARSFGTNDVDNRARLCHVSAARTLEERLGRPATTGSLADLAEADVIVVAGANPAERQPVAFDGFVRPAVRDGATLVHVDPVGNATTRLADVHLSPRPGHDTAVFDLLAARVLADGDAIDREFVAERTRGFERFAESARAFDAAAATTAAGVDPGAVDRVVERIGAADRVAALTGTGVDGEGAAAPAALLNLLLSTGNVARPGSGLYVLRGLANEQGAVDAGCAPDRLPGHAPVTDAAAQARVADEWGFEPPADPGRTAPELLDAFGDEVRGALIVGENPVVSKRDRDRVLAALDALDHLVVLELRGSGTAARADVVLPAAAGTEKAGTFTNLERRVQRFGPAVEPPGAARPDFRILRAVGRRAFGDGRFDHDGPADAFAELGRVAPTHAGVAHDALDVEGRRWPFGDDGVLYRDSFDTPDGRARFGTVRPVPEHDDPGSRDRLHLVAGGRVGEAAGPGVDGAEAPLRLHPDDAADRGIGAGDRVRVSAGEANVTATARPDEETRRGTVHLPAAAADPLLRSDMSTIDVEAAAERSE